jgi:ribosome-binding protein aMBF1 (putative translation factor)
MDIENLISSEPSGWLKDAEWRIENRQWLMYSFEIALQTLIALREQGKKKKWLAEQLGVSRKRVGKMLNGSENFTIKTISQLESILGIKLVETAKYQSPEYKKSK